MPFKQKLNNLLTILTSTFITYLALELIVPYTLNLVPLTMYNALPAEIRALGQSSKNSVVPKNYIALVGDSYAQGQGDWLKQVIKTNRYKITNPDYHSGHIIHHQTGLDVITYGMGGAGSVKGLVTAPIIPHRYINSLWPYNLTHPNKIIIYFYEGNDFSDNAQYYTQRYLFKGYDENYFFKGYSAGLFYDTQYFDQFLQKEALERYPPYSNDSRYRHFIFASILGASWENLIKEMRRGKKKIYSMFDLTKKSYKTFDKPKSIQILNISLSTQPKLNSSPKNIALINEKKVALPAYLQGPPVTLSNEEMKRSTYIFERTLLFLAKFFSQSEISIIYIPGPASIYSMIGPNISLEAGEGKITSKEQVTKASQTGCKKILEISRKNRFQFLDTRSYFRKLAKTNFLHGPEDYQHLNRVGQTLLAELIIKHILSDPKDETRNFCKEQT